MKSKLMLMSAVVAGTVAFLAPQIAKADTIILDSGMSTLDTNPVILDRSTLDTTPVILDRSTLDTTPVIFDRTINTVPLVQPTIMETAPVAPVVAPDFYTVHRRHFLHLGLGGLMDFGLF